MGVPLVRLPSDHHWKRYSTITKCLPKAPFGSMETVERKRIDVHEGAVLIDPSAWIGERAVDLAMMRLFGGFPEQFWHAYETHYPIPRSIKDALPFYQIYYLLVHVHLFGAHYLEQIKTIVRRYGY